MTRDSLSLARFVFAALLSLSGAHSAFAQAANLALDCSQTTPATCAYVTSVANNGQPTNVTPTAFVADPVCKQVTNRCAGNIMVPTATQAEWSSFLSADITNPNSASYCASLSACTALNVVLTATPSTVTSGNPTTLSWVITGNIGAVSCTATSTDNTWSQNYTYPTIPVTTPTGTASVTPVGVAGTTTYTLTCHDTTNVPTPGTANVTVNPAAGGACQYSNNFLDTGPNRIAFTGASSTATGVVDPACAADAFGVDYYLTVNGANYHLHTGANFPSGGGRSSASATTVINGDTYYVTATTNAVNNAVCASGYTVAGNLYVNGVTPTLANCVANYTGTWIAGSCSATCGGGTINAPTCSTGNLADCDPALTPASGGSCNTQACPAPTPTGCVYSWHGGSHAYALGANVKVTCQINGTSVVVYIGSTYDSHSNLIYDYCTSGSYSLETISSPYQQPTGSTSNQWLYYPTLTNTVVYPNASITSGTTITFPGTFVTGSCISGNGTINVTVTP